MLFIVPVILSFAYKLLRIWIEVDSTLLPVLVEETTEKNKETV